MSYPPPRRSFEARPSEGARIRCTFCPPKLGLKHDPRSSISIGWQFKRCSMSNCLRKNRLIRRGEDAKTDLVLRTTCAAWRGSLHCALHLISAPSLASCRGLSTLFIFLRSAWTSIMAATIAASKACFSQLAFSSSAAINGASSKAAVRPVVLPRRNVSKFAVRASLETKESRPAVSIESLHGSAGTALAASVFSMLATSPSANAAQEIAQLAEGADYRPFILLVVLGPAIGWVAFNILQPALRQFQTMLNKRKGVIGAIGLGAAASAMGAPTSADAAQEFAQLAEGTDSRPLILLLVLAPALGWVAFNILKPALRQLEQAIAKNK